jgi:hypothetical protein
MKGATMAVYACFLAILFGATVAGSAGKPPTQEQAMPTAADQALADMEQVGIVLATDGAEPVEPWLEVAKLKTAIVEKLNAGGVKYAEQEPERGPTLVVQIEGRGVPGSAKCVYRVQTSLDRSVLLPSRRSVPIRARVWQARPAMAVAAQAETANAIAAAVLAQAETFAGECKAARRRANLNASAPQSGSVTQPNAQNPPAASTYAFIASRNGAVFHRPDCRWAQNITADNLVGYQSREEALRAGKRPCKSCKP